MSWPAPPIKLTVLLFQQNKIFFCNFFGKLSKSGKEDEGKMLSTVICI